MSYRHQDLVFELTEKVSSSERLVLLALAYRANESGECWPSLGDLACITSMNVKTVRKCINDLVEKGLVLKTVLKGKSSVFTLNLGETTPTKIGSPHLPNLVPLPKTVPLPNLDSSPSQNWEDTPTKIGSRTNKEQVIEQVIVKETNKESFEDFDAPLSEQIENAQLEHCENVLDDPEHVLTSVEMVVFAKTLGVRLTNNAGLQEIANRKTLTVDLFRKSVEKWVSTGTGTGYLIGILKNASLNPDCVSPKKAEPKELTVDTITDKQAGFFASKLVRDTGFCCRFGKGQSDYGVFASKVAANLRNPRHFDEYKPFLLKLGLMNNGETNNELRN